MLSTKKFLLQMLPQYPQMQPFYGFLAGFRAVYPVFNNVLWNFHKVIRNLILEFHIYGVFGVSVQFSSVTQSCPTLCDPVGCSTPGFPGLDRFNIVTSVDWNKNTQRESCEFQFCLGTYWILQPRDSLSDSSEELLQRGRGRDQHIFDFWEGICAIKHKSL